MCYLVNVNSTFIMITFSFCSVFWCVSRRMDLISEALWQLIVYNKLLICLLDRKNMILSNCTN